ncbi:MAG: type II toxin-antitoxin system Phd/YefM family antitoxin [Candidatus Marinimicrobia bacterium]|nr:type II toxin-antitoxin system Phd/YefM family antitoxin [Candidatus Neomarinimicrobiota bacterium]
MKRINLSQDIKSLSDFRANAALYVQNIKRSRRPLVITQNGKSSAVLINVDDYEALLEKIELLQDIRVANEQLSNGEGIEHHSAINMILGAMHE